MKEMSEKEVVICRGDVVKAPPGAALYTVLLIEGESYLCREAKHSSGFYVFKNSQIRGATKEEKETYFGKDLSHYKNEVKRTIKTYKDEKNRFNKMMSASGGSLVDYKKEIKDLLSRIT